MPERSPPANNDEDANRLFAYFQAVQKQGGKLLIPTPPRTPKDATRQRAAAKTELKKTSN